MQVPEVHEEYPEKNQQGKKDEKLINKKEHGAVKKSRPGGRP